MSQSDLYKTDRINDVFVIRLLDKGMLDSEQIPKRQSEIQKIIHATDAPRIVLDLSSISFMSSTALGMLVTLHKGLIAQNRVFEVCSPQPDIREVLEITMFHTLFPIHDSLDVATAAE